VEGLQIIVGVFLVALGVLMFLRTRLLIQYVASLEEPPLSQAHRDRISGIVFVFHLIAGFTSLSGLAVMLLAAA
jgi:uncharacterized membrane protein YfcA